MKTQRFAAVLCALLAGQTLTADAQGIPAFPGAEGAGAISTGGRPNELGGIVYHVTTLDPDPTGSIPGSLRYGLNSDNFSVVREDWFFPWYNVDIPDSYDVIPRIIVFDVGGTIDIGEVDITPMNVTLAGQTAPGGITLYGGEFNPGHRDSWDEGTPPKVNNLILRNFAVRTHDPMEKDGLWLAASNSIADHVSLAWYTDEGVSVTDSARNVTIQHSIIGPGWASPDGDGSQLEGKTPGGEISVHHNLYVHNDARVPRLGEKEGPGIETDFRNNVVYNVAQNRFGYSGDGEPSFSNFVNNYYIGGRDNSSGDNIFLSGDSLTRLYQSGNLLDMNRNGAADGVDTGWSRFSGNETQLGAPVEISHGVTQSAQEALETVLDYSGARWWDRDFLDQRSIDQTRTFGQGSDSQAGRVLSTLNPADVAAVTGAPMQTRPAGWDTDNDGMPNHWEERRGLDPNNGDDWRLDDDTDGYINLEEYLNELAEWPAPYDIQWTGGDARYAEINNWSITRPNPGEADTTTHWQPSRFDRAVIGSGDVTVDAPGQHAGAVQIDGGSLSIVAGELLVEDETVGPGDGSVQIGATGELSVSGGRLIAKSLGREVGGDFSLTGGKLSVDEVGFELVNQGGVVAPGYGVGQTTVLDDTALASGALEIEIASPTENDLLTVAGRLVLGGDLVVELLDGFAPTTGSWLFATAAEVNGSFDSITPGFALVQDDDDLYLTIALAGDYNGDGRVDAADYTVWRDLSGQTGEGLAADGNGDGSVDATDYDLWRTNFGSSVDAASLAVPEPSALLLLLVAAASAASQRR